MSHAALQEVSLLLLHLSQPLLCGIELPLQLRHAGVTLGDRLPHLALHGGQLLRLRPKGRAETFTSMSDKFRSCRVHLDELADMPGGFPVAFGAIRGALGRIVPKYRLL
jgi:hypothetical protein